MILTVTFSLPVELLDMSCGNMHILSRPQYIYKLRCHKVKGRRHYLVLVHQTGEGTLVVVHGWKAIYVPHTTGIAESIDLTVRR